MADNTFNQSSPDQSAAGQGGVSAGIVAELAGTATWLRICAIVLAVFAVLSVGNAVFLSGGPMDVGPAGLLIGQTAVFVVFYAVIAWLMFRYARAVRTAGASGSSADFEVALNHQRRFWKIVGILTLLAIVLFVVALVGGIVAGVLSQMP